MIKKKNCRNFVGADAVLKAQIIVRKKIDRKVFNFIKLEVNNRLESQIRELSDIVVISICNQVYFESE